MSQLVNRPDYIIYGLNCPVNYDEKQWPSIIKQFEDEPAIVQWHKPYAFMWHESALRIHSKVLAIPVLIVLFLLFTPVYIGPGWDWQSAFRWPLYFTFGCFFFTFGFIYYISRSQYYDIAYKLTESGLLRDNLKRYPRFRYRDQDTTSFLRWFRWIAVVVGLFALFTDPMYLAGAGGAIFMSFMKPQQEKAAVAIYGGFFWNEQDFKTQIYQVKVYKKRRIISLESRGVATGSNLHCLKDNFEEVLAIIKEKLPNAEFVYID